MDMGANWGEKREFGGMLKKTIKACETNEAVLFYANPKYVDVWKVYEPCLLRQIVCSAIRGHNLS